MFTLILYVLASLLLILSFFKDPEKTKKALKKAWKAFDNILPQLIGILVIVGLMLAVVDPETISRLIGGESGLPGMLLAAVVGGITLIPGFVAFPLAATLLNNGAGFMQIAVFISTLMMVGVVTLPVEIQYFGKRAAVLRNTLAFSFSFIVALVIGGILG
jgi:uncharacterized membrane protein YraQ (UPF0718 family)